MRQAVERVRRPVFSLWIWLILTPILLTAYGGFDEAEGVAAQLRGVGVAVLVHVGLGVVFLIAGLLERRIRTRGAWIAFVAVVLVAIAVLRPLAVSALQDLVGTPSIETPMWLRMTMNGLVIGTAVVLGGTWLRAADRTSRSRDRLRRTLEGRNEAIEAAERATDRLIAAFAESVARPVRDALQAAKTGPFDPLEQSERLRNVAHEVVRPLSHRALGDTALADADVPRPAVAGESRTRRPVVVLPTRFQSAPVWLPILLFVIITTPPVLDNYDLADGWLRLGLGGLVGLGLNLLVARIPLRSGWRAILAHALGYLAVGLVLATIYLGAAAQWLPAARSEVTPAYWVYLPIGYAVVAVVAGLATSLLADARGGERALTRAIEFAEERAADSRARYEATANDVARILHNQVQGDILATSLQLRMGAAGEHAIDDLIANVERALAEPAATRAAERTAQGVRDAANAALVTWSRVMDVSSEAADPDCWRWLASRPAATALFLDANTEALTNAARHVAAAAVDLRLERIDGGVRMLARNRGRLAHGPGDGVGLSDLRRRGARVSLVQEHPDTVLLTVDILDPDDGRTGEPAATATA